MEWILFSMLAALLFASGNFLDKFTIDKQVSGSWDYVFSYGLVAWVFVLILFLFTSLPLITINLFIGLFAGFLVALTGFFFARALKSTETSKMVVLFQVIPLVAAFGGWIFLGQELTALAWVSFVLILVGGTIALLDIGGTNIFSKGALDIIIFGILWGVVFVVADYLLLFMNIWEYMLLQTIGLGLSNFLFLLSPEIRKEVFASYNKNLKKYIVMLFINSIDFLGKLSIVYAIGIAASVGLVTVVLQVQSLFSIIIGAALTLLLPNLFKEDLSFKNILQKVVGGSIIFVGILLLFI